MERLYKMAIVYHCIYPFFPFPKREFKYKTYLKLFNGKDFVTVNYGFTMVLNVFLIAIKFLPWYSLISD